MILRARGLCAGFGATPVIEGIDLDIAPGERVGLWGDSGSGKSLLLAALLGHLPRGAWSRGEVARPRLAAVFQDPATALDPLMRVGAQVAESGRDVHVAARLAEVGLDPSIARAYPHQLSGGQRQRAALAAALAATPELLVLDEPTSMLDEATAAPILALLSRLASEHGLALLVASHDPSVLSCLSVRPLALRAGKLVPGHPGTQALPARPNAAVGEVVLRARGLAVSYPAPGGWWSRSPPVAALHAVDLDLRAGTTLGVVGPSGAGKSTLARALLRLLPTIRGRVELCGREFTALRGESLRAARRDIQVVFQDPVTALDPRWPVGETVGEALAMHGLPNGEEPVNALLREVGLGPVLATRLPSQLSGGQRQRACLARALAPRPRVLVLDEPVSALDHASRRHVVELLQRLQVERGLAYLLISHDLDTVSALAHEVRPMEGGKLGDPVAGA